MAPPKQQIFSLKGLKSFNLPLSVCVFVSPQLSLLSELGFGGVLLYIDPCDAPPDHHAWHQAFRVTLNPGGNPAMGECSSSPMTRVSMCNVTFYLSVQVKKHRQKYDGG